MTYYSYYSLCSKCNFAIWQSGGSCFAEPLLSEVVSCPNCGVRINVGTRIVSSSWQPAFFRYFFWKIVPFMFVASALFIRFATSVTSVLYSLRQAEIWRLVMSICLGAIAAVALGAVVAYIIALVFSIRVAKRVVNKQQVSDWAMRVRGAPPSPK